LASNIESSVVSLSSMESILKKAQEEQDDDSLEEDEEMKRRINIAKLVSCKCGSVFEQNWISILNSN
jgi:hypothetical protein